MKKEACSEVDARDVVGAWLSRFDALNKFEREQSEQILLAACRGESPENNFSGVLGDEILYVQRILLDAVAHGDWLPIPGSFAPAVIDGEIVHPCLPSWENSSSASLEEIRRALGALLGFDSPIMAHEILTSPSAYHKAAATWAKAVIDVELAKISRERETSPHFHSSVIRDDGFLQIYLLEIYLMCINRRDVMTVLCFRQNESACQSVAMVFRRIFCLGGVAPGLLVS